MLLHLRRKSITRIGDVRKGIFAMREGGAGLRRRL